MVTALGPTPLGYGAGAYAPTPTLEAYAPGALGPTLLGYGAGAYAPTPTPEVSNSCIHTYVSSPTIQPHNESGVPPLPTQCHLVGHLIERCLTSLKAHPRKRRRPEQLQPRGANHRRILSANTTAFIRWSASVPRG